MTPLTNEQIVELAGADKRWIDFNTVLLHWWVKDPYRRSVSRYSASQLHQELTPFVQGKPIWNGSTGLAQILRQEEERLTPLPMTVERDQANHLLYHFRMLRAVAQQCKYPKCVRPALLAANFCSMEHATAFAEQAVQDQTAKQESQ